MSGLITLPADLEDRLARLSPEDRAEAESLLADYYAQLEANPLLRFEPHRLQAEYLSITTNIGAAFAGNRFGKTSVSLVDGLIQLCDSDAIPDHLKQYKRWHEPIKARICAPKFNENIEQVIFPELKKWVPRAQLLGGAWDEAFSKSKRVLQFANGSTVQFLTYDQDVDAHAGGSLHWILFDEEPEGDKGLTLYRENQTRLGDLNGDFRMAMTPLFGLSWAYDEIYKQRLIDPDVTVIQGSTYENPHISHARLEKDAQKMSKEERQARREGKFVHFAGQFYPEFGDAHLVDPPKPKDLKDQSIIVGIDPGLNYTGVVWVAFDNDNVALVFAELKPEQQVPEDVAKLIHGVNKTWGIDPDYYVIDPSARNRATVNREKVESAYQKASIPVIHGQNDRAGGILEVKARLQHDGLLVSRNCPKLADEFEHYRKDPNSSDEFAAVKKNDHCFPAGTMVATEAGDRPIEEIEPGDRVWTRFGLFPVLDAGLTREDAPVRTLTFEDGRTLTGTDEHPVYVGGEGEWVSLKSVRYGDRLFTCPKVVTASTRARKLSGTGSPSIATPTRLAPARASTSQPRRFAYIALSGRPRTVLSPRAFTSTTSTGTPGTTTSPTLSSFAQGNTSGVICRPTGESKPASTCAGFSLSPRLGTRLRRARRGTESRARASSPPSPYAIFAVTSVERLSRAVVTTLDSASPSVAPLIDARKGWTTSSEHARSAVLSSPPTSTQSSGLAPVRVAANRPAGRSAVYNLTVDGPAEYFANGLLVHNCLDALRYVCMERLWTVSEDSPGPEPQPWQPGSHVDADWLEASRPEHNSHPLGSFV